MKQVFLLLALALTLGGTTTLAQEKTAPPTAGVLLASVSLTDASVVQNNRDVSISFTLTNRYGVQPGVKYAILLARETKDAQSIEDIFVEIFKK